MSVRPETAEAIATSVLRVMKLMAALRHHAPRPHPGVDPSHYPVLFVLASGPRRVSALAEATHSDVSTVSRQVSHLVQQGIVEKIGDPKDGRAQLLSLTSAGEELIETLVRARGKWFEQLLASWSDEDARTFAQCLARFGDDVESFKTSLGVPSSPPPAAPPPAHRPSTQEH